MTIEKVSHILQIGVYKLVPFLEKKNHHSISRIFFKSSHFLRMTLFLGIISKEKIIKDVDFDFCK